MVEGRILAGVVVSNRFRSSGGGLLQQCTLSGGGNIVIGLAKNALIGCNAALGIGFW